jgi:hypothetical protein
MNGREMLLCGALGFAVWLSGALEFRYAGEFLFERGPWIAALSAIVIAISVCLIFRTTLRWRRLPRGQAVTLAVVMGLPGLFGEAVRQLLFVWATGLKPEIQPVFAATLFFGNAALLACALWTAQRN